jgi:isochorismate synthase
MTTAYAFFRLPHTDRYTAVEGEAVTFQDLGQLDGQQGFVIAPFQVTADQPVVLIRPDRCTLHAVQPAEDLRQQSAVDVPSVSADYHTDFVRFHEQLVSGTFKKIVLARSAEEELPDGVTPEMLFQRACACYPRLFVALVYTPQTGLWLTATPEILLDGCREQWRTIALAGTMQLPPQQLSGEGETVCWNTKNIQEQRLVATYIAERLECVATDIHEEGPRTVRAANLVHLRSDFTFRLDDSTHLGQLLTRLHPTPAVCGLPKDATFRFIVDNEHTPRRYYSGFMGMLHPDGETHLYVSLRCMNIVGNACRLYAGGGLLKDSQEELEWQETEAKLQTMRRLIK